MEKSTYRWIAAFIGLTAAFLHSTITRERKICELEEALECEKFNTLVQQRTAEHYKRALEDSGKPVAECESK